MGEPALDTDKVSWVITPPFQGGKTPPAATILKDIFTVRKKSGREEESSRGTTSRPFSPPHYL